MMVPSVHTGVRPSALHAGIATITASANTGRNRTNRFMVWSSPFF
jgi:hypothetical protein